MAVAVTKQQELELDVRMIPMSEIKPNINIREIDKGSDRFKDLVSSVKEKGVLEPVLVRPFLPSGFQLVAGYSRYYANKAAGNAGIPARIKELTDAQVIEVQLVENLQRSDMSEIDEALAFKKYIEASKSTQLELGKKIGKSQPYIANRLRLLELHPAAQERIRDGMLSASHGEILLKIPQEFAGVQGAMAKQATSGKWTVEQLKWKTENAVRQARDQKAWKEKVAKAAFKTCPSCKAPAARESYDGAFECSKTWKHRWDPKTGKAPEREASHSSYSSGSSSSYKPPPPPPPILESKMLRSSHTARELLDALLDGIKAEDIVEIDVGGNGRKAINIQLGKNFKPPAGEELAIGPCGFADGNRSAIVLGGYGRLTAPRRKSLKKAVQTWERRKLKPRATVGKALVVDTKILQREKVSEIYPSLNRLSLEELDAVRAAEVKGKKRQNVLQEIDQRVHVGRRYGYY